MSVGIWQISDDGPKRMRASNVELEQHLEDWIAEDTSLLQAGLVVVGRQVSTAGGPLDLLAVDPQGRWIVIEIKRGQVRRDTVAQALDYASCIVKMDAEELRDKANAYLSNHPAGDLRTVDSVLEQRGPGFDGEEEREVALMVVGTSQDPGLERMVSFLGDRGNLTVSVVSFEVFALPSGERVLVRELTESDAEPEAVSRRRMPTMEELYEMAEAEGTRDAIQTIVEAGERAGLYPRTYKESVFLTPMSNKNYTFFGAYIKPSAEGSLRAWAAPDTFSEFFDSPAARVEEELGNGMFEVSLDQATNLAARLEALMEEVESGKES